jgi:hypothetical protein
MAGMEDPERPLAGSAIAVVPMDAVFSGVEDIYSCVWRLAWLRGVAGKLVVRWEGGC